MPREPFLERVVQPMSQSEQRKKERAMNMELLEQTKTIHWKQER